MLQYMLVLIFHQDSGVYLINLALGPENIDTIKRRSKHYFEAEKAASKATDAPGADADASTKTVLEARDIAQHVECEVDQLVENEEAWDKAERMNRSGKHANDQDATSLVEKCLDENSSNDTVLSVRGTSPRTRSPQLTLGSHGLEPMNNERIRRAIARFRQRVLQDCQSSVPSPETRPRMGSYDFGRFRIEGQSSLPSPETRLNMGGSIVTRGFRIEIDSITRSAATRSTSPARRIEYDPDIAEENSEWIDHLTDKPDEEQERQRPHRQADTWKTEVRSKAVNSIQPLTADPSTDLGKIQALRHEFHTGLGSQIQNFIQAPPTDKDERNKKFRRLHDMVSQKVFEPGDAIKPEGWNKEEVERVKRCLYREAEQASQQLYRFITGERQPVFPE